MKRTLALLSVAALTASLAGTSVAAVKKPAPPKPVTKTYYLHGANAVGNQDQAPGVGGGLMRMDAVKPQGSQDRSFAFYGVGAGGNTSPNQTCAGGFLNPNWIGAASGNLTGSAKVTFYAQGAGTAKLQLFADVEAQACAPDAPTPLGEVTVALPAAPGPVTVSIPISKTGKNPGKVAGSFTLQIGSAFSPAAVGRVLYDSTTAMSSVTFTCIPKVGKKSC